MLRATWCALLALVLFACQASPAPPDPAGPTGAPDDGGKEVMHLQVTVIVSNGISRSLHGLAPATDESRELVQSVESLGYRLAPMHPGVDDPALMPYFIVEVPDMEAADRVIARLERLQTVEGAYVKPPDEPP